MPKFFDPFELLYYIGSTLKKKYSFLKQKRLPSKVISIGNITTGGTGKTPATIALAEEAKKRGFRPVILTRGYKGRAKEPVLINFPFYKPSIEVSPETVGDEAFMVSKKLPDVPIVKVPNRYLGAVLAFERLSQKSDDPIIFILDDGFQQWQIFIDVNIVLIDGINPFGNGKMLPFGRLRELPKEIKRADIIIITKVKNDKLINELRYLNPHSLIFTSEYEIKSIKNIKGDSVSFSLLQNKKIYAFCGIAEPASFISLINSCGAEIVCFKRYPDHYRYKDKDLKNIFKEAERRNSDYILTTEKDIIKVSQFTTSENILYLDIYFSVDRAFYNEVFRQISEDTYVD